MKAAVVEDAGRHPVYADFAEPELTDRRQLVSLVAAGIHPIVRSRVAGQHYSSSAVWPAVPGVDAVARTADGRLVYTGFVQAPWGTMAERMAAPEGFGMPLPDHADPLAVAAGLNPGLASWLPLVKRRDELADRTPGGGLGTVLVLGATGMAGSLAVDNAFVLGAQDVVAVGRNAARLDQLRQRADSRTVRTVALTAEKPDAITAGITQALAGRPPSIVLDFLWGSVAEATFQALGHLELDTDTANICYVEIGSMAAPEAAVPSALLRSRRVRISGSGLGSTPVEVILRQLPAFLAHIADGEISVPYRSFPLSRITDAWEHRDGARAVVVPD